jgi:hypothetical protein
MPSGVEVRVLSSAQIKADHNIVIRFFVLDKLNCHHLPCANNSKVYKNQSAGKRIRYSNIPNDVLIFFR